MKRLTSAAVAAMMVVCISFSVGRAYGGPPGADIDAVIFSEDFEAFDAAPFDPGLAYFFEGGQYPYEPNIIAIMPDFTEQDSSWSSREADYIIVGDEKHFDPNLPDPCNYALCVYKHTPTGGQYSGYAVKDIASILDQHGRVGDKLFVSFDAYMPFDPNGWEALGLEVSVLSRTNVEIANLLVYSYSEGRQWLTVDNGAIEVTDLGADWEAPSWRHYELYIDFGASYVEVYIGEETTERVHQSIPSNYTLRDVAGVGFGSLVFYRTGWTHHQFFDNVLVSTNFVCPIGDVNDDCSVDMLDLAKMTDDWLVTGGIVE